MAGRLERGCTSCALAEAAAEGNEAEEEGEEGEASGWAEREAATSSTESPN